MFEALVALLVYVDPLRTSFFVVIFLSRGWSSLFHIRSCFQTATALIYDAVHLFAKALDGVSQVQEIQTTPLQCSKTKTWTHGNSIINYMKMVQWIDYFIITTCQTGSCSDKVHAIICSSSPKPQPFFKIFY